MDTGLNIMDKDRLISMSEDRQAIDKNACIMDKLLGLDKGMDKNRDIIDKDGLRSMYEDGWIIDKYA